MRRAQSSGCILPDRSSSTVSVPLVTDPMRMPVSSPLPVSSVTAGSTDMTRTSTSDTGLGSSRSVHSKSLNFQRAPGISTTSQSPSCSRLRSTSESLARLLA